ncbi:MULTISPECIES: hypothetical protein [unclassified Marinobacter]|uniref:hypothetical protein n=2 Tax=unclassified Marinobacter TaxID=83889 RepID=UPI001925EBFF|nr:hypothetical protein [Marinobacter sp. MC3]MBL3825110.1 hypothetical protein [Marinobacter sp. MC3]MBL3893686.1 hypothetical protein [Marinobacter sp. MW3]
MKHPMQNIKDGRFVKNEIVEWLLDNGGLDMNDIAVQNFSQEDREHFAQLIGYSVSGWGELSYVSDESFAQAERMAGSTDERDARIAALEAILEEIRKPLRQAACAAFAVHPDDLSSTPE